MSISKYEEIPGFCNNSHYNRLSDFMSCIPNNSKVLEIGCGWGKSTWAILDGLSSTCSLYVCDTFTLESDKWFYYLTYHTMTGKNEKALKKLEESVSYGQLYCFLTSIENHHKRKVLKEVYIKKSFKVLENDNSWDAVYLDGNHNYMNVYNELNYLKKVPYLCGDDYDMPSVRNAIEDFIEENPNRKISVEDNLWIIK